MLKGCQKVATIIYSSQTWFNILDSISYYSLLLIHSIAYVLIRSRRCVRSDLLSSIIVGMDLIFRTMFYLISTSYIIWSHVVVVVVYSYFLYCNKQTSAKTQWTFKVIMPSQQGSIYIYKIKSNNSSEVWCEDIWLRRMLKWVRLVMLAVRVSTGQW